MAKRRRLAILDWMTTGRIVSLLVLVAMALAGRAWLAENPQHNPWAPLNLHNPPGWATGQKLSDLRGDVVRCHAVFARSEVDYTALAPSGEGACARPDRMTSAALPLAPNTPQLTCPVAAGMALWMRNSVQPQAVTILGSQVAQVEHLGTYSCRRMYNAPNAPWSEHATGNAIDIAAFVLEDGRRISVLDDWAQGGNEGQFLRAVRDGACESFGTVLSPDYNTAHADHFHLDQGRNPVAGACR